jgi:DNA-binding SARP family transcriptional activator
VFDILGPLVLRGADDQEIALVGPRRRALLVRLLLDRNRPVAVDRLIEDLWEGDPPRSAVATLQSHVSHLRRALGADRLITRTGGYVIVAGDGELDTIVFEGEVSEGRRLLAADDAAASAVVLQRAISRWRGIPLADAAGAAWAQVETARLGQVYLFAIESLVEVNLLLGQDVEALSLAEAAVADHPLQERLWAQLMTALYRAGRQAEALRAYQRLRTHLADEVGIDPSPELRALEQAILAQDPALRGVPRADLRHAPAGLPTGVVSFLMSDVAASTRMWEEASDVMSASLLRHDEIIRSAIKAHAGVLLKSRGEGDSTFSVFGRATDAVAAAREVQIALLAEPWPEQTPIRVRMALHTGETIERDGDYFGRSVNRVARLRAVTEAGQVMLSQATAELVIDHLPPDCHLVEVGVQELRDLARPEVVYLLAGAGLESSADFAPRAPAGVIPLPARLAAQQRDGCAGRGRERDRLSQRFHEAAAGQCRVVLIAGEPGIGKTTLAAAAALGANDEGATVLLGRCDEDIGLPYQPWIEALGHLVGNAPTAVLAEVGPRKLADLAGLIPEVAERHPRLPARTPTDPDTDRYLLFASVVAIMAAAAAATPVVLVIDDLHWSDKPTLLLLRYVLRSSDPMRLLVIATFRDREISATPALGEFLASVHGETGVERMSLSGLEDADIVEMMERVAGHELDEDGLELAKVLRRDTDGNPFFAGEMLRHLAELGLIYRQDDDRWVASVDLRTAGLPQSVRDVVGQRVARLGVPTQQVMRLAAVIGHEFDLELLAAVCGKTEHELVDLIERAQVGALVVEVSGTAGRYSFAHALIQQTLYEELGATRRQLAHRRVAEALEDLCRSDPVVRIGELAQHWMAAARPADAAKAIGYARRAGDAAVAALAPDEAVRWYGDALNLLDRHAGDDTQLRTELLIALGTAQRQGGDPAFRETLLEAARLARQLGHADGLVRAVLANTRGWHSRSGRVDAERVEMLEAAMEAAGAGDSAEGARLLKLLANELAYSGDPTRCRALDDAAVEMARRIGDPATLLHVLLRGFAGFWAPDSLDQRLTASREAVILAEEVGDPAAAFWAYSDLAFAAYGGADRDESDRAAAHRDELARRLGQPALDWVLTALGSTRALLAGELDEADRLAERAFELATNSGQPDASALIAIQLAQIRWHQGRDRDMVPLVEKTVAQAPTLIGFRALLARACLDAGEERRAREIFNEVVGDGIQAPWDVNWLIVMCWWADVAVQLGHAPAAQTLYDRLAPWHAHVAMISSASDSAVCHYLGTLAAVLGKDELADEHFSVALAVHTALRAPFHVARTQLEWGRVLLGRGPASNAARGRELLDEAWATASQFGYGSIERAAATLLDPLRR